MLKRLGMILPSEDEVDASSAPQKPIAPIFTKLPSMIPAKCRFQLYSLDHHQKTLNDSPASAVSTEVLEIISIPIVSIGPQPQDLAL